MEYTVVWPIEIEADSHLEAARLAREFQLDPDSLATWFMVAGSDGTGAEVDLAEHRA